MTKSISVKLHEETARALEELARATDRPKTYFIENALDSYIADYSDYCVALDRLHDKDDPVVSSADLRRRLARHPLGGYRKARPTG